MNEFKAVKKSELKKALSEKGIECAHLDDLVHDAASELATAANNNDIDGQLDFLLETCGWSPEDILNKV